ncbi:gliding motility protein GldN [Saccharicrinis sp. FJH62]|uniref:type IX secretion system ring protein PorN/GldN n=1 Tax=Saccharicrinis sp. FJH62 TaxID=3344657 RepID=UPI0035D48FEA
MTKKIIIALLISTSGLSLTFAQEDNSSPLKGDKPIEYMSTKEGDIDLYYEYKIWRTLNLEETPNQPLALPKTPIKSRKNLGTVIIESIGNENFPIPVHQPSDQEMTQEPLTPTEIYNKFNLQKEIRDRCILFQLTGDNYTIMVKDGDPKITVPQDSLFAYLPKFLSEESVNNILTSISGQIYKYDLYEVWFFNKRYSTFKSEIRAICPYIKDPTSGQPQSIGWIPFDQLRRYLVQVPIKLSDFNATVGMNQYSMDAYFTSRLYSGEIVQAENLQGKRFIDYNLTPDQIAKQRQEIETRLINLEEDIWAY